MKKSLNAERLGLRMSQAANILSSQTKGLSAIFRLQKKEKKKKRKVYAGERPRALREGPLIGKPEASPGFATNVTKS
eukprot:439039-Pelagomonas_calceolata.AAC.1